MDQELADLTDNLLAEEGGNPGGEKKAEVAAAAAAPAAAAEKAAASKPPPPAPPAPPAAPASAAVTVPLPPEPVKVEEVVAAVAPAKVEASVVKKEKKAGTLVPRVKKAGRAAGGLVLKVCAMPLAGQSPMVRQITGAAAVATLFWAGVLWMYATVLYSPKKPEPSAEGPHIVEHESYAVMPGMEKKEAAGAGHGAAKSGGSGGHGATPTEKRAEGAKAGHGGGH